MSYFKVDPFIVVFFSGKPIFQDEVFENVGDFDADIFGIYHWHVKVDFFYVDGQKICSFASDDTV
jgi:hypothetical protein